MPSSVTKDPADVIDVQGSHAQQMALDEDTIEASDWRIENVAVGDLTPLAIDAVPPPTFTDTTATVWVSGGTTGRRYHLTNTVDTAGGRTHERTIPVYVRNL